MTVIVVAVGFAQGFLGGLFGAGGPILVWFISTFHLPSLESRTTFQVSLACEVFIRIIYTYCIQTTNAHVRDVEYGYAFIVIMFTSLSGLAFCNWFAHHYLNPTLFAKLLVGLLAGGSVLIVMGGLEIKIAAIVACTMLSTYAFLALGVYFRWERFMLHLFCKEHKILHLFDSFIARWRGEPEPKAAGGTELSPWADEEQLAGEIEEQTKRPGFSRQEENDDGELENGAETERPGLASVPSLAKTVRPGIAWQLDATIGAAHLGAPPEPEDAIPNPILGAQARRL